MKKIKTSIVKILTIGLILLLSIDSKAQEKPTLKIGGALRLNYNLSSWKDGQQARGGDFGFDVFRINAKAQYKGWKLNAEYRLYSQGFGGGMLKQGWVGYDFDTKNNLQIGLTQVPFGNTMYNSHSWFFAMDYYVGLEDDFDMGVKYTHKGKNWDYALAFFKNAEELTFGSYSDTNNSRYSYDVASMDINGDGTLDLRNKETNQANVQINYKFGDHVKHNIGVSGQFGGLYNLDTKKMGNHTAAAVHYRMNAGNFDAKAQFSTYKYNPNNPAGESDNVVAMTAYGAPYLVAAQANVYSAGIAYNIPIKSKFISGVQIYNDFSYLHKINKGFEDAIMNVTGALISAGSIYTYVDYALGKNQPWLGGSWTNGLGAGLPKADWESRFNINIGYYF